jgi:DNA-binding NtrC family response regulator
MLTFDRFLMSHDRAIDLATGATVRIRSRRIAAAPTELFSHRGGWWLIDCDRNKRAATEVWERGDPSALGGPADLTTVESVFVALQCARDGRPQSLDVLVPSLAAWARGVREMARLVRLAGFVPIAAEMLGSVLEQARWRWPAWLEDRSLVIFVSEHYLPGSSVVALLRLARRDQRPHLMVRGLTKESSWRPRLFTMPTRVHESPVSAPLNGATEVDSPERLARSALELADQAPPSVGESTARWTVMLADSGDVRAAGRCALARSLLRQGRLLESRAVLSDLDGVGEDTASGWVGAPVAKLRADFAAHDPQARREWAIADDILKMLQVCQDVADERSALTRVAEMLRDRLAAGAVGFLVRHHAQVVPLVQAGPGDPALATASRVLETAVAIEPEDRNHPTEGAWPVRYGGALVGTLWCRWPTGLPVLAPDASLLAGIAASACAPNLYAAAERRREPDRSGVIPELVGESAAMRALRTAIVRAAASPFPVLIEGESGSGKELVARAIHAASERRDRRFCALNCAALSDELVEAELFGHARGAFTGAVAERQGLFEDAQGGTLFLDEIGELSARVQAKLLRVLQESEVRRLGESRMRRIDVRIVAATNRRLAQEVQQDRFRRDLWYRLDVIRIDVPPLRERLEDLPALVRHLWSGLCERTGQTAVLSPAALAALGSYDWPGNVRELQNVLASIVVAAPRRAAVGPDALPSHVARAAILDRPSSLSEARREFETRYVRAALARAGGRHSLAARELGVSRQGLSKLTKRLGVAV